jgi:preprotein translocase subunit SecG
VQILYVLLSIIQVLVAVGIILLVNMQQPRNEGIGASIGSATQSSFKGKASFEERLSEMTRVLGIAFFVVSILVVVVMDR